ncbi:MAG6790 family protein [Mycoplasma phocimorsus]|uniref:MAG6790 family protein n=1 Tax=Mycoplasma phocimorsus TaxID=3045839 RepID=UPI0024C0BC7D|nr:hypothetical protein [Mycoplasma phocimorsus]MDJ1646726.1 hypothetical protein [Mycoplasma phocimorsus]MDJ1648808.1 hypothetical protein [Mycoplasma phocimorsus]
MYQYKAILNSTKEVIASEHTIEEIEKRIVHFKRRQKYHEHTRANEKISIYHVIRNNKEGAESSKEVLIKEV